MPELEMHEGEITEEKKTSSPEKEGLVSSIFDYLEILVFSVCAVLLIFSLFGRICRVDGGSMMRTLYDGQTLVTTSLVTPENGDIIVFHQTSDTVPRLNEPLVKRVIATEGQTVRIDYDRGEVYVDGKLLDESAYISLLYKNPYTNKYFESGEWDGSGVFETTVPDGCYFVMGDNRNQSLDSRSAEIGCVDARRVLGKVVLRLHPFTLFN